jgi:hypothetical protein
MPEDPAGGAFLFVNTESTADSRLRQLPVRQYWLLYVVAVRAAEDGRSGWVPIEDGETAADALVRISPSVKDGPPSRATAQAALDRFEELGLVAVEPGRIQMTAPEIFSYEHKRREREDD